MKPGLLRPGAFLFGLFMVVIGSGAFALIRILPPASVPGGDAQISSLLGSIGGGMIGIGMFAMLYGLLRNRRR